MSHDGNGKKCTGTDTRGRGRGGELLLHHTNTTRCHICSNHDGTLAGLELVEYPVAFVLLFVAVNSYSSQLKLMQFWGGVTYKEQASRLDGGIG